MMSIKSYYWFITGCVICGFVHLVPELPQLSFTENQENPSHFYCHSYNVSCTNEPNETIEYYNCSVSIPSYNLCAKLQYEFEFYRPSNLYQTSVFVSTDESNSESAVLIYGSPGAINLTISEATFCSTNSIESNVSVMHRKSFYHIGYSSWHLILFLNTTVSFTPPGVQLYSAHNCNSHNKLTLVCEISDHIEVAMDIKFFGPNQLERLCPRTTAMVDIFTDGTTTRIDNQVCVLHISKPTSVYYGDYFCDIRPTLSEKCQSFRSSNVSIDANTLSKQYAKNCKGHVLVYVLPGVCGGLLCVVVVIVIVSLIVTCYFVKKRRNRGQLVNLAAHMNNYDPLELDDDEICDSSPASI